MALRNTIIELLPDIKTLSHIINYFYTTECNIMILHQLFLIATYLSYDDEIGNREMINVLRSFLLDTNLDKKSLADSIFRKIDFGSIGENYEEEINENRLLLNNMENNLLPHSRRIILSMEDLLDHALKILFKIHYNINNQFFLFIMDLVNELKEIHESAKYSERISEMIIKIKECIAETTQLEEKKKKDKNRLEIERLIIDKQKKLDDYDEELISITREEKNIIKRELRLCEFLIKYTKLPVNMFNSMINDFIFPAFQKKEYPEVMRIGYTSMGVLAINYFNDYKKFLKLFFEQIEKSDIDFHEFDRVALTFIFDSMLQNNVDDVSNEIM